MHKTRSRLYRNPLTSTGPWLQLRQDDGEKLVSPLTAPAAEACPQASWFLVSELSPLEIWHKKQPLRKDDEMQLNGGGERG